MELNYQINSKVRNKDNYDLIYSIIGKKNLNGIMHYQLQSNTSEIYLSEFALNERFIQVDPNDEYNMRRFEQELNIHEIELLSKFLSKIELKKI